MSVRTRFLSRIAVPADGVMLGDQNAIPDLVAALISANGDEWRWFIEEPTGKWVYRGWAAHGGDPAVLDKAM